MKFPTATVFISLVLIGLILVFGAMPENLIWQQHSPYSWQLLSTHFVHINTEHVIWNLGAFVVLASVIEQHSKQRLFISIAVGCLFVSLYLLNFFELPAYAGLSGALNTLFVVALYQIAQKQEYRLAASISLAASIAKILFEWLSGDALFSSLVWPAVPAAHLAGIIGGVCYCLILNRSQQKTKLACVPNQ